MNSKESDSRTQLRPRDDSGTWHNLTVIRDSHPSDLMSFDPARVQKLYGSNVYGLSKSYVSGLYDSIGRFRQV